MKREQVKKLLGESATDELIDAIMKLNGESIESHKTQLADLTKQVEAANQQITEANTTIEGFKKLNPEQLQAAADEWKTKFEQAQEETKTQLAALKFDHALEGALNGAKAKNVKAVKALLEMNNLKMNDADGSIIGLDDQLKAIQEKNDYLFNTDEPAPRIVSGGNNKPVVGDVIVDAARKAAGL